MLISSIMSTSVDLRRRLMCLRKTDLLSLSKGSLWKSGVHPMYAHVVMPLTCRAARPVSASTATCRPMALSLSMAALRMVDLPHPAEPV